MKHIVCLTFDFDTWSGFAARQMLTPTPISRGEFGLVGAKRILALLEKHAIPATWFVPGIVIDSHEDAVAEVVAGGHEIAHHGYSHAVPSTMTPKHEEIELVRAIEAIVRVSGQRPRGYRSPSWDLSPVTLELLIKHGLFYDSSMMAHDVMPYFARMNDIVQIHEPLIYGEQTSLVEIPISWSLDDHPHFEYMKVGQTVSRGLSNASSVLENFLGDFIYMRDTVEWGVLTYTFHPYVIGRGHRMLMLSRLIEELQNMGAIFMTMEQAAREFAANETKIAVGRNLDGG